MNKWLVPNSNREYHLWEYKSDPLALFLRNWEGISHPVSLKIISSGKNMVTVYE